jgi:hypothetical protein
MNELKIGLIGLDTSHAPAFAKLLNDTSAPHHVEGGRIVTAFAGGSPDFGLSRDRIEGFTAQVHDDYGVSPDFGRWASSLEAISGNRSLRKAGIH